ncbi:hypothetical protein MGG_16788 [Pyricularia oryzae 70-15]|uniref:Uncharacterized protein n=3 Tax=Pyricularia oryzae TaxID=318829 RepID=G4N0X1_PYRO7|nr:uncharacterized protein MGG_16788 [Pyricularia oryzae 70-15]EHA52349.1 hypothetical protein MGG_16788 [Pyricularia oryzae 70-15]ELQ40044.1 hypothetical protein OOU_Y34scaffold00463g4 [Pyricularia oryzae Y34]
MNKLSLVDKQGCKAAVSLCAAAVQLAMNGRIAWVTVPLASVGQNNVEAFHRLLSEQVKHVKGVHRGIGFTCNQAKRCDLW